MSKIRPIAIYLPQFHPIPENDAWWGKGFTEWTNVTKAKPLFKGHYQPHLPADLGFYDLRLPEVREAQAKLAKDNGIYGFCYYHYWFNGRRILERPFTEVLESGKPDFPFMLCWANENWTKAWDGDVKNIILNQTYSEDDSIAHMKSLLPAFRDKRYIRIDGKVVFAIYRSTDIKDIKNTIKVWRNTCANEGIELYLCRFESFAEEGDGYLEDGFDAAIRFEPFSKRMSDFNANLRHDLFSNKMSLKYLKYKFSSRSTKNEMYSSNMLDYSSYVNYIKINGHKQFYKQFPCITPMWDNSARRKTNFFLFKNSTPQKFKEWAIHEIQQFTPFSKDENLFFINAWNEWAEGNHLEPCMKWGNQYLQAFKEAICEVELQKS